MISGVYRCMVEVLCRTPATCHIYVLSPLCFQSKKPDPLLTLIHILFKVLIDEKKPFCQANCRSIVSHKSSFRYTTDRWRGSDTTTGQIIDHKCWDANGQVFSDIMNPFLKGLFLNTGQTMRWKKKFFCTKHGEETVSLNKYKVRTAQFLPPFPLLRVLFALQSSRGAE